jgi:hypothetical protein
MRALVLLVVFVPAAAFAGPLDRRPLRMPDATAQIGPASKTSDDAKVRLQPYKPLKTDNLPLKTLNLGPFQAEVGGERNKGHFASYHLEGTRILGGSLGGTVDGGEAKLELTWPSH